MNEEDGNTTLRLDSKNLDRTFLTLFQVYKKFKKTSVNVSRNECEICGFVPYTKNKYREKQDHLAKVLQVIPITRELVVLQTYVEIFLNG